MDLLVDVIRPIHIVSAAFWFGAAVIFHGFVEPLVSENDIPALRFFVRFLAGPFTFAISVAAVFTILAGVGLYWRDSHGFQIGWTLSAMGASYTAGALSTLAALLIALTVTGPSTLEIVALGKRLEVAEWSPESKELVSLRKARTRLATGGRIGTGLLAFALLAMSVARSFVP